MRLPKQLHIDNGQIGGTIQIILQSMFLVNFATFVSTLILLYNTVLYKYVQWYVAGVVLIIGIVSWWIIYYVIVYPSIITFVNRQQYTHKNPIREDIKRIENKLDKLMEVLSND